MRKGVFSTYRVVDKETIYDDLKEFTGSFTIKRRMDALFIALIIVVLITQLGLIITLLTGFKVAYQEGEGTLNMIVFILSGVFLLTLELYKHFSKEVARYRKNNMMFFDLTFDEYHKTDDLDLKPSQCFLKSRDNDLYTSDGRVKVEKATYFVLKDYAVVSSEAGVYLYKKDKDSTKK